jgi:hypothetical protein
MYSRTLTAPRNDGTMVASMSRYATVTYEKAQDYVHIEYLPVTLATWEDVAAFKAEIDREMAKIHRKVDIIVNLGELSVKPAAVAAYDTARQRMLADYGRNAYRYSGSGLVRTRILTSSTIHGQSANVFSSFVEALEAMHDDRARER